MSNLADMEVKSCSIVILTYKGIQHLELLLPTVKTAIFNTSNYKINVLIVDNGCDEKTKTYCRSHFPEFEFEFSPKNDYLFSLNDFVEKISSSFTFILNDDMKLHPDVLNKTLDVISKDERLFAVTCNIMDFEGKYETTGLRTITVARGWARISDFKVPTRGLYYTWFAGGGAAIFNTKMFNLLKGFDPLYRPAYCEDSDISMRAWHRGWKTVYHPEAILYHRVSATIRDQFKANQIDQLQNRQKIILFARNLRIRKFIWPFLLLLPYRLLLGWKVGKNSYFALWKSVILLPSALLKRLGEGQPLLSDSETMKLVGKVYER